MESTAPWLSLILEKKKIFFFWYFNACVKLTFSKIKESRSHELLKELFLFEENIFF